MEKLSFRKLKTPLVSNIFSETVIILCAFHSLHWPIVKEPQLLVVWPLAGHNYSVM